MCNGVMAGAVKRPRYDQDYLSVSFNQGRRQILGGSAGSHVDLRCLRTFWVMRDKAVRGREQVDVSARLARCSCFETNSRRTVASTMQGKAGQGSSGRQMQMTARNSGLGTCCWAPARYGRTSPTPLPLTFSTLQRQGSRGVPPQHNHGSLTRDGPMTAHLPDSHASCCFFCG